jgi:hypothetical protein
MKGIVSSRSAAAASLIFIGAAVSPAVSLADVSNPVCPVESVFFDPGNGEDIVVPAGYKVEVFAKGLNFPTDVAFLGNKGSFQVLARVGNRPAEPLQRQHQGACRRGRIAEQVRAEQPVYS